MDKTYLAHVNVHSTNELSEQQMEELFCYLELQLENGTIVRVELAHYEQI